MTQPFRVVLAGLLGLVGIWRLALAVSHYRSHLAIVNDPSLRELEQASAIVEAGLGAVFLVHAATILWLPRRLVRLETAPFLILAVLTGALVTASFRTPEYSPSGAVAIALLVAGFVYGFRSKAPWLTAYFGVFAGGTLGLLVSVPSLDPFVMLAVLAPLIVAILVGVGLGRVFTKGGS